MANPFLSNLRNRNPYSVIVENGTSKSIGLFLKIRFLYGGNFGENYCFGLEQLPIKGDTLFITGGEKDVFIACRPRVSCNML